MPSAPLRACGTSGTPGCQEHRRPAWSSTTPVERIRGRKLQRLRLELWDRDPRCRVCRRVLLPSQMIRDHIVNLQAGGQDIAENTQGLCEACHTLKTEEEKKRGVQHLR